MNRDLLIPRRNRHSANRFGRMVGKYRYYRSIGVFPIEAVLWAWRATK